ncbi:hypothetical protein KDE13_03115 [Campylobacter sp. faydin G-140]|uniref:hypothetical protein n=1 Tax=Campylobacter anatolicus TaxID=2829105 RepID=UPI001B9A8712|nr:hypothetical protein [Campylobacter anatolicus]MBR8465354.1 hypothetical protein [Campylobacter anatolicus]
MLKLFKVLLVSILLTISADATDFLSKVTGGALSDNDMGVKRLNNTKMNQVFGGSVHPISSSFSFENTIIKELRQATKDRLESDINNLR